jgi:outer membrane protein TolC
LAANLDLKTAEARVPESRAALGVTSARLYPTLDNSWSYTQQRYIENTPFGSFPQIFPPEYNLFEGGFDSSWEVDLFGGVQRSIEAARADTEASIENLHDIRITTLAEVAHDYIAVSPRILTFAGFLLSDCLAVDA